MADEQPTTEPLSLDSLEMREFVTTCQDLLIALRRLADSVHGAANRITRAKAQPGNN